MTAWKAFFKGLSDGRRTGAVAIFFYLTTLIFSTLALGPWSAGLHATLDEAPAATELLKDRGLDLLVEMALPDGGRFFITSLAGVGGYLLLFLPAALFLMAGAYGAAAHPGRPVFPAFGEGGVSLSVPFAGLFAMNLVILAGCALAAALPIAGVFALLPDTPDPGPAWWVFLGSVPFAAFVLTLWRNSVGYAQAARALGFPGGLGRVFLRGFMFSLARFIPVNLMAWGVNGLRLGVVYLSLFAWRPGYATEGAWLASAVQLQAGFFALAYLRAAEVRMQVEYLRAWNPEASALPATATDKSPIKENVQSGSDGDAPPPPPPVERPVVPWESSAPRPMSILR